jgi:quercetin dioxygenase-like cupin family protein
MKEITSEIEKLKKEGYKNIFIWEDKKGIYYNWHTHPYEEIRIMLEGEMIINTKTSKHHLKKGDILKVPPNETHEAYILEDCKYICASKY